MGLTSMVIANFSPPPRLRLPADDRDHARHRPARHPRLGTPHVRRRPQPLRRHRLRRLHHGHRRACHRQGPQLARNHPGARALTTPPRCSSPSASSRSSSPEASAASSSRSPSSTSICTTPSSSSPTSTSSWRWPESSASSAPPTTGSRYGHSTAASCPSPSAVALLAHPPLRLHDISSHVLHRPRRRTPPLRATHRHPRPRGSLSPAGPCRRDHPAPHHRWGHRPRPHPATLLLQSRPHLALTGASPHPTPGPPPQWNGHPCPARTPPANLPTPSSSTAPCHYSDDGADLSPTMGVSTDHPTRNRSKLSAALIAGIKELSMPTILTPPGIYSLGAPAVPVTLMMATAAPVGVRQLTSAPAATAMATTGVIAPRDAAARANASPRTA